MNIIINPDILTYVDDYHHSLTIDCQKNLNQIFSRFAYVSAKKINYQYTSKGACRHYYQALADFMNQYPQILIEPTLLKPDPSYLAFNY